MEKSSNANITFFYLVHNDGFDWVLRTGQTTPPHTTYLPKTRRNYAQHVIGVSIFIIHPSFRCNWVSLGTFNIPSNTTILYLLES